MEKNILDKFNKTFKNNRNTIYDYIDLKSNSSIYKLWIALTTGLILFTPYIEEIPEKFLIIDDNIVKPLSFKIIYSLAVLVLIWVFFSYIKKRYIISNFFKFVIYLISAYYLYLRIFPSKINFISISNNNLIVYSDLLIILLGLMLILEYVCYSKFYKNKNKEKDNKIPYLHDNIYSFSDEEFNNYEYKSYIEEIESAIKNMNSKRAFTIAINSRWGTGKTTFMKALENRFDKKEYIVVNFNVWKYDSKEALLKDYFSELENEFQKYSGNSKNTINEYFSNLFFYAGLNFKNLIENTFSNFFLGKKNPHDNIKRLIERIDKKIIVLIDDLDRLKSDEINQTLKLIRNNSEFDNFFIISTIDEEYIINEGGLKTNFLEKVFNLQIDLPFIPSFKLFDYYINQLNSIDLNHKTLIIESSKEIFNNNAVITDKGFISFKYFEGSDFLGDNNRIKKEVYFHQLLTSRRQVNRFLNQLKISIINIKNENDILFRKYILLQLLFFRFPIYKEILNEDNLNNVLIISNNKIVYDEEKLSEYLESRKIEFSTKEKSIINILLGYIFEHPSGFSETHDEIFNDIILLNYFPIYYNQNIYSQTIDLSEIIISIKNKKINSLYKKYKERPNFDRIVFKNICLINGNYTKSSQIISTLNFLTKNYEDEITANELLIFINEFNESFYNDIFNYISKEEQLIKSSILLDFYLYIKDVQLNNTTLNLEDVRSILKSEKITEYLSLSKINKLIDKLIIHITNDLTIEDNVNILFKLSIYSYDKLLSDYYIECRTYSSKFLEDYKNILAINTKLLEILYLGSNLTSDIHYSTFEIFLNEDDKKEYEKDLKIMHSQNMFNSEQFGAIRKKYLTKGKIELLEFINSLDNFDKKEDVIGKINHFYTH
ncbi:P-loop NTPase fold protein [Empedobacter falsenii]